MYCMAPYLKPSRSGTMLPLALVKIVLAISHSVVVSLPLDPTEEIFCANKDIIECHKEADICGTDGITYKGTCFFAKARCSNSDLAVQTMGQCHPKTTPSATTQQLASIQQQTTTTETTTQPTTTPVQTQPPPTEVKTQPPTTKVQTQPPTTQEQTQPPTTEVQTQPTTTPEPTTQEITTITTTPTTTAATTQELTTVDSSFCATKDCTGYPDKTLVCGTDGKIYLNRCNLKIKQCDDPTIQYAHDGFCIG